MPLLDEVGAWGHPMLAIFDSWGNVNVPLTAIERIGRNISSEVIMTFGPNWFSRREGPDAQQLDALVFGTGHEKGVEVMKEAMWKVDGSDGMGFRDPRTRGTVAAGQQSLFDVPGIAQPELLELVKQRLAGSSPVSLEGLGSWLLLETARWRASDARKAVENSPDLFTREPPGRLSRTSLISAR